jgi:selenocysteine lyase/cysteine desulfurase
VGSFGLRASLELILAQGIPNIAPKVLALTRRLAEGLTEAGFELMLPRDESTASGILSCRKEGQDSSRLVAELKKRQVLASPRQGWIRFSPHFYLEESEMDLIVSHLRELTS